MNGAPSIPNLPAAASGSVTTARVCQPLLDGGAVVESPQLGRARARLALVDYEPAAGDRVLVATDESGNRYVIGVIGRLRSVAAERGVTTSDGTRARVRIGTDGREALQIVDGQGQLLIEHRPDDQTTVVTSSSQHLEIAAPGRLRLAAGQGIELACPERLDVQVGAVDVTARRAAVDANHVDLAAKTLSTTAERVQLAAQALELRAHRIVERAHEVFRDVEGLSQTRAGRLKLLASHALDLVGRHTQLRAEQDVKVKGDRVYLG